MWRLNFDNLAGGARWALCDYRAAIVDVNRRTVTCSMTSVTFLARWSHHLVARCEVGLFDMQCTRGVQTSTSQSRQSLSCLTAVLA